MHLLEPHRKHLLGWRILAIGVVLSLLAGIAAGQSVKGSFIGTVRDTTGAVVPDVKITVTNLDTNVASEATTDATGGYLVPFLDPGNYSVAGERTGFKRALEPKLKLDVAAKVRVDLNLEVGQATQTVEVSSAAPLVQSDTSDVGMVVTSEKLTQLPLLGRNYQALAQLSPSAVSPTSNPVAGYMAGLTTGTYWQLAGQRGAYTAYTADGIETNNWVGFQGAGILQSLDTIGEYKVQTHNFSAEFGRGTVQYTSSTRSGTNSIHGSAYEFVRNDKFNANDFFANRAGRTKRAARYNQFGATVGGPIYIPKIYNGKDRTFFFFGYEGTRFVSSGTAFARYPDPAWFTGDFSNLRNTDGSTRLVYDPTTVRPNGQGGFIRQPFAGNRIPSDRFDPVAVAAIPYVPAPTSLTDINPGVNTVGSTATRSRPDQYVTRLDHNFSSRDRLYGRYMQSKEKYTNSSIAPLSGAININNGYNVMVSETHVFTPSIFNEFRFGFNRANFGAYQEGGTAGCITTACEPVNYANDVFKLKNIGAGPLTYGLTGFGWSGYSGIGGPPDSPLILGTDTYQFSDNVVISRGRHQMKGGFIYGKVNTEYASETFSRGSFAFNGQFTQGTAAGQTASGNPVADFLLGYSYDVRGLSGDASGPFQTAYQGYYFQDDFRVNSRLTVNLGLRYEYYSPYSARKQTTRFDFGSIPGSCFGAGCPAGYITVLGPGQPVYAKNWNDWSPRIGLAFSPFSNRTVIRASYGIFYTPSDGTDNGTWGVFNPPQSLNFFFSPTDPYTDLTTTKMSNQFPGGTMPPIDQLRTDIWPLPALSLLTQIPVMKDPTVHQWQLTVQHELKRNLVAEVGYMGSRGYYGQRRMNYNQARLDNPGQLTPLASRMPYPVLSSLLFVAEHSAVNTYNAGFVRLEQRFSGGLSFVGSYTFSKTIDDYGNLNGPGAFWPQYSYNKALEKGLSAFHAPHRFTAGYVWENSLRTRT